MLERKSPLQLCWLVRKRLRYLSFGDRESTASMKGKASTVALLLTVALCAVALFGFRLYQSRVSQAASEPAQQREGQNWQGQRGNQPQGGPGAGRGGPQYPQGGGGNFGSNQPPLVEAGTVTKGMITEQLWLVGSLKPKSQVEVLPKVTGKLQRILVDVGDMVREGQLIAELEGDELEQQVLRAEAALAVAEATLAQRNAELENARADGERAAQLAAEGLMSVQARQTAETRTRVVEAQLKTAEAQMRQAQADLAELKIRQQQTKITSPLTGWVGKRYVDPGALLGPNTPIVSVLQLSSLITEVRVPEQSLSKLRPGNRAVIYID